MKHTKFATTSLLLAAALLGGCGDRAHSDQLVSRRNLQPSWDAASGPFVVPGWKSGDQAAWQAQMTRRAQNQNEYLRTH